MLKMNEFYKLCPCGGMTTVLELKNVKVSFTSICIKCGKTIVEKEDGSDKIFNSFLEFYNTKASFGDKIYEEEMNGYEDQFEEYSKNSLELFNFLKKEKQSYFTLDFIESVSILNKNVKSVNNFYCEKCKGKTLSKIKQEDQDSSLYICKKNHILIHMPNDIKLGKPMMIIDDYTKKRLKDDLKNVENKGFEFNDFMDGFEKQIGINPKKYFNEDFESKNYHNTNANIVHNNYENIDCNTYEDWYISGTNKSIFDKLKSLGKDFITIDEVRESVKEFYSYDKDAPISSLTLSSFVLMNYFIPNYTREYRIDETFANMMLAVKPTTAPIEYFNLPFKSICLEMPKNKFFKRKMNEKMYYLSSVYMVQDYRKADKHEDLEGFLNKWAKENDIDQKYYDLENSNYINVVCRYHPENDEGFKENILTIAETAWFDCEARNVNVDDIWKRKFSEDSQDYIDDNYDDDYHEGLKVIQYISNIILYIVCSDIDVTLKSDNDKLFSQLKKSKGKKRSKIKDRIKKEGVRQFREVGKEVGKKANLIKRRIKEQMEAANKDSENKNNQTRFYSPGLRPGHTHKYWIGKRRKDARGKWIGEQVIIKWVHATMVGCKSPEDEKTVMNKIYDVK